VFYESKISVPSKLKLAKPIEDHQIPPDADDNPQNWPRNVYVWVRKYGIEFDWINASWSPSHKMLYMPIHWGNGYCARNFNPKSMDKMKYKIKLRPGYEGPKEFMWGDFASVRTPLVITEDLLSAKKAYHLSGAPKSVMCLFGTSLSEKGLHAITSNKQITNVWVHLDDDHAGLEGAHKILHKLRSLGITSEIMLSKREPKQLMKYEIQAMYPMLT
jgi:hypothetical protein